MRWTIRCVDVEAASVGGAGAGPSGKRLAGDTFKGRT